MKRIDERDVIFARLSYKEGTRDYNSYYAMHPELKERDGAFRAGKGFGSEGTMSYDPVISPFTTAAFSVLNQMHPLTVGTPVENKVIVDSKKLTTHIKKFSEFLGAVGVGVAQLEPQHYYSYKGRGGQFGKEIQADMPYGIAFIVEMKENIIDRSPQLESAFAVTKGYMDAAIIGIWIAEYLRNLGYEAKAHMDGSYDVNCPMVAQGAGLGEIGRIGILINPIYGPRVRIGVVTTNAPLVVDKPLVFDVKSFCEVCNKCSQTCPGKAISKEGPRDFNGFAGWNTNQESCYEVWTRLGTDCGVCLSTCPFSHHVSQEYIGKWTNNPEVIHQILKIHEEKYGIRPYIKQKLSLISE